MALLRRKPKDVNVIDLREPSAAPAPVWGSPVPCPACSGRGYLDHIDPFREVMFLHCLECSTAFEISRAELESSQHASTA